MSYYLVSETGVDSIGIATGLGLIGPFDTAHEAKLYGLQVYLDKWSLVHTDGPIQGSLCIGVSAPVEPETDTIEDLEHEGV